MKDNRSSDEVVASSGNVFTDLGLKESPTDFLKLEIIARMTSIIESRGLTQAQAAKIVGADQAKISQLLRGHHTGYTVDRLFRFMLALGFNLDVRISGGTNDTPGKICVR